MSVLQEFTGEDSNRKIVNFRRMLVLLSALSSERNLKLFQLAKSGLRFDFSLLSRLQLSRKQYYKGISQLQMLGLIHKIGSKYYQSTLGLALYQGIFRLSDLLTHNQVIQVMDLCRSMQLDTQEIIDILKRAGALDSEALRVVEDAVGDDSISFPEVPQDVTSRLV